MPLDVQGADAPSVVSSLKCLHVGNESKGINRAEPLCRFDGSLIYSFGTRERLNRGGWNWFMPSPPALYRMMREAGFDEIQTLWHDGTNRVYGYGRKVSQVGICKAGLSVPNIK